jgi:hypothetical protein
MEQYLIEDKDGHRYIFCHKRKLEILVIDPEHFIMAFGRLKKTTHPEFANDVIICFCLYKPDLIEYEPYFRHLLITNALNEYVAKEWHCDFDEVTYSPAYQEKFIDTMSLDPKKMTPELIGYMARDISEEPLDFFQWKEKHLKPFLN